MLAEAVERAVDFFSLHFELVFFIGLVVCSVVLNEVMLSASVTTRVILAIIDLTFVSGVVFSFSQFMVRLTVGAFEAFSGRGSSEIITLPEVNDIADRMGAPRPKAVRIVDNPRVTAVTNAYTKVITASKDLYERLPRERFLAIIAHEVAHLKNSRRFTLESVGTIVATVGFLLSFQNIVVLVSPILAELTGLSFFMLLLILIMHHNEFRADMEAKEVGYGDHLVSVLNYLRNTGKADRPSETHPSIKKRISRLYGRLPQGSTPPISLSGRLGLVLDRNWRINFTKPERYRSNGITYHVMDYSAIVNKSSLMVIDAGCSYGVASRTMKRDLAKHGLSATVYGVDIAERVRKKAEANLDHFVLGDITKIPQGVLPEADVVICSFAVNLVSPEIKYNVLLSCANHLNKTGALVTNAFPYERVQMPAPWQFIAAYVGALPSLKGGRDAFATERAKRKEALLKMRSRIIIGRDEAVRYAEHVKETYANQSRLQKLMLLWFVFMQDPVPYSVTIFRMGLDKVKQIFSDLTG